MQLAQHYSCSYELTFECLHPWQCLHRVEYSEPSPVKLVGYLHTQCLCLLYSGHQLGKQLRLPRTQVERVPRSKCTLIWAFCLRDMAFVLLAVQAFISHNLKIQQNYRKLEHIFFTP